MLLDGQCRQKLRDLLLAHLQGVTLTMEEDKAFDPTDVCLLGAHTIVPHPDRLTDLVKQLRFAHSWSTGSLTTTMEWPVLSRAIRLLKTRLP
jgi:hypothetical protein